MLVDFHNHILPGVDDGARDSEQTRLALLAMHEAGVRLVIATPHLRGSLTTDGAEAAEYRAAIARGFDETRAIAAAETPDLRVALGAEVLLDDLNISLEDKAVRLAGTRFVLVEFSLYGAPPNAADILFRLRAQAWQLVLGHPERYGGVSLSALRQWRDMGTLFQMNAGSPLGDYGPEPRTRAWELLRNGMIDYVCSDYHARGKYRVPAALAALEKAGGKRQRAILTENGLRLSRGEMPVSVPPLARKSWVRSLFSRR